VGIFDKFFKSKEDEEKINLSRQVYILGERLKLSEMYCNEYKHFYEHELEYAGELYNKLQDARKMLFEIMASVCRGEYITMQLGGSNHISEMTLRQATDFIIKNVKEQYILMEGEIAELKRELKEKDAYIEALETKNLSNEAKENDTQKIKQKITGDLQLHFEEVKLEEEEVEEEVVVDEEDKEFAIEEITKHIEMLKGSPQVGIIFKAIGESGVFRTRELRNNDLIKAHIPVGSYSYIFGSLKESGLLEIEKVHTGRKGYFYDVFWMNALGKQVYKALYGKPPVVSGVDKLFKEHATIRHGCMVLDASEALKDLGFNVSIDRKQNTLAVPGGKRKIIVDIIAEKENEKRFIEVETGNGHSKEEIYDKMDRLYEVTKDFWFVAPNGYMTKPKCQRKVFADNDGFLSKD